MKYLNVICLFAASLLFATPNSYATEESAEKIAKEYFSTLQKEGIVATSKFMHPDALQNFKTMMLPVYEAEAESGRRNLLQATFGPDGDASKLKDLDPLEFMNGFMNLMETQMGGANITFDDLKVIGTLPEGELRHVLSKISIGNGEMEISEYEVLTFKPYKNTWRLELGGEFRGMAEALRAQVR